MDSVGTDPSSKSTAAVPTEHETIRHVLAGERSAYRHLVRAHQDQIFAMIMRQVKDENVARELTQDAFLKAYLNLSKFRFKAKFSTWLTRIALNLTHSYFSSRRYKEQLKTTALDSTRHENTADEPHSEDDNQERIEQLRTAIRSLKPKFRDVVVLCALEKKKYEEAAEILEIPIGTVRSRLNKARLLLREAVEAAL